LQGGCEQVGGRVRIYLAGEICIERRGALLHEHQLPGPQGRHLFALLAAEHARAVGHDEIAEELWGPERPRAWRQSLKALTSRTRTALATVGLDDAVALVGAPGLYGLRLPRDAWIVLEAATSAVHDAEASLRNGDAAGAVMSAFVGRLISARPLLPGRAGPWLDGRRRALAELRIRALECAARARLVLGQPEHAVHDLRLALEIERLREPTWRLLMDAYAANGDVASALLAYERCRNALRDTLGVGPSAATRARHEALLALAG
jgi:DNA-binding SARP family transcriptional activator